MLVVEIAKFLDGKGILKFDEEGLTGDCFIATLPQAPDEIVAIYPYGGTIADGGDGYRTPNVQILVRGTQHPMQAMDRAQQIYDALHGFHGKSFVTGGLHVVSCLGLQSGPTHIGTDETGRHEISINFQLEVK